MAITPLPAVPLRSDAPATFVTKADAFLGALNLFATEVDAVGVALTLGATNATSTTSLAIGLGSKSLTVQTGKSYVVGMTVKIASTAVGSTWMLGDITSYTTGTGALVVTVTSISGSGTLAAWTISQSAPGGAQVGANADITSLSGLTTPLSVLQGGTGVTTKTGTGSVVLGTTPTLASATLTTPTINSAQVPTVSGTAPLYMCRAWVNFNSTGTVAIRASGNVSSITDIGVGDYTVNFTTAMPDANYSVSGTAKGLDNNSVDRTLVSPYLLTTGNFGIRVASTGTPTATDAVNNYLEIIR
jgi:hypothetical protein